MTGFSTIDRYGDEFTLPDQYAQVVYINTPNPNSATVFDAANNPPVTHDPLLVQDSSNLYIGSDGTSWVWRSAPTSAYISAPAPPASTEWFMAGSSIDAAGSKTAAINRSGNVGLSPVANFTPVSRFDLSGTLGMGVVSTAAAAYSIAAADAPIIRATLAGAQTLTLPAAASVPRRAYWLVNPTSFAKIVSSYQSISGVASTALAANTSIAIVSDGSNWIQFDGAKPDTIGVPLSKKVLADIRLANWASPWATVAIPEFDIVVPARARLVARYVLRLSAADGVWGIGLKNRGFAAGSLITGRLSVPNFKPPTAATGNGWFEEFFTEAVWDSAPNTARQIDISFAPFANGRAFLEIDYENKTAAAVTFGWNFGADVNIARAALNLKVLAGSTVNYTLFN